MEETPFSNREIREMFSDVTKTLSRIEMQTTATNGKVAELQKWKYISMGAVSVLTFLVVPLLTWALYTLSNINNIVHMSVDQALQAYNVEGTR